MSKRGVKGPTTSKDLQKRVADYVERNDMAVAIQYRCLDLVCEVGELTKELLEQTNYGQKRFTKSPYWADEFGDVVFALFCLANSTGIDIEEVLLAALNKYSKRVNLTGSAGSR